jgi:hypothetical protein
MPFFTRFCALILLLAATLPLVLATTTKHPATKCKSHEFYFDAKKCCVPYGGKTPHPKPPKGKNCPPQGWSWNEATKCCVPHAPLKKNSPPPQCKKGLKWCDVTLACEPKPTPVHKPNSPSPSANGHHGLRPSPSHHTHSSRSEYGKRAARSREPSICPVDSEACPIATASGLSGEVECIDTSSELESCGGCTSIGQGQDCTAIEGAWNVGCNRGKCEVLSCADGYTLSASGQSCQLL